MRDRESTHDGRRRRRVVGEDERASEAVVAAVATATDEDPSDLPPLGDRVDVDCLDGLLASGTQSTAAGLVFTRTDDLSAEPEVSFTYAGYDVTVTQDYVVLE